MLTSVLLVWVTATPVELHAPRQLSLLPRNELASQLRAVDDELRELSRVVTLDLVAQQSAERITPFVMATAVPLLGLGFFAGLGGKIGDERPWLVAALPLAGGVFAAVVYIVGSVIEHYLVVEPERGARREQLARYRPVVVEALEQAPAPAR